MFSITTHNNCYVYPIYIYIVLMWQVSRVNDDFLFTHLKIRPWNRYELRARGIIRIFILSDPIHAYILKGVSTSRIYYFAVKNEMIFLCNSRIRPSQFRKVVLYIIIIITIVRSILFIYFLRFFFFFFHRIMKRRLPLLSNVLLTFFQALKL